MVWHPHCLVSDGCFDKEGIFHPNPEIGSNQAMIVFREKVFSMLKDHNRISDVLISKMRQWNHSGFSVYHEMIVEKDQPEKLEKLAEYIVHFSIGSVCTFLIPMNLSFAIMDIIPTLPGEKERNWELKQSQTMG